MTTTLEGFSAAVSAVHMAEAADDGWSAAMEAIAAGLGAAGVSLLAVDTRNGSATDLIVGGQLSRDAGAVERYRHHFVTLDPTPPLLDYVKPGAVMQCHHWITDAFTRTSEYYNDFLLRQGGRFMAGSMLLTDGPIRVSIGVHTGVKAGPLQDERLRAMALLLPHIRRAYQGRASFERQKLGSVVLENLGEGVVVANARGEIFYANRAAREWAAQGWLWFDAGGMPRHPDNAKVRQVAPLLRGACAGEGGRSTRIAFHCGTMSLLVVPLHGYLAKPFSVPGSGHRLALVTIRYAEDGVLCLAKRCGLTPAETAVAKLAIEGRTSAEIARFRGVSRETVRTQIRAILGKTGAHSLRSLAVAARSH